MIRKAFVMQVNADAHGAHCRMRRERFIRPTKACKFNILHELYRHDKTRKRRIRQ